MEHACAPQQLPDPKHQLFIDTTRAPNQSNTMVGFRSLSMLCLMLFASSIAAKQTTVGVLLAVSHDRAPLSCSTSDQVYFSNEKETKSVKVTLNDCTNIDEEYVVPLLLPSIKYTS